MTDKPTNTVDFKGTTYNVDDMPQNQQYMVAQLRDIQRKIQEKQFELDQLTGARSAYSDALTEALAKETEEANADNTAGDAD